MDIATRFLPASPPRSFPRFLGFGFAGSCRSALEVGGDVCDIIALSESSLLMVIADVMGKGLPAALFAASLRSMVRGLAKPGGCPSRWLTELNHLMFEQLSGADMFITAQLVVADLHRRRLQVGNAGHCPLLLSDGFHPTRSIAPEGMPLGIQLDTQFSDESVVLEPFTSVLLYTDGLTEARDPAGQFLGQPRLESWFQSRVREHPTAIELKSSLLQELATFQDGEYASDDQTFLFLSDEAPRPSPLSMRAKTRWSLRRYRPEWAAAQLSGQR